MPGTYQAITFTLTALFLPAFGYLYLRYRNARTLLWFLGFLVALFGLIRWYAPGPESAHPWYYVTGQCSLEIGSALFLASLSPIKFRAGRFQVFYVIPYILPLVLYTILLHGAWAGTEPIGPRLLLLGGLGAISLGFALVWSAKIEIMPARAGVSIIAALGILVFWAFFTQGAAVALVCVESANFLVAALFVVFTFRRVSPGVILSVAGFAAWSLHLLNAFGYIAADPSVRTAMFLVFEIGKVMAAVGMILLTLEDELACNQAAQERERRARRELEAYSGLMLARRRVEDFDSQGNEICEAVVGQSRFARAALLLYSAGRYRLAGHAGMDDATVEALADLAARIPVAGFLAMGSETPAVERSQTVSLDLAPWLESSEEQERLEFSNVLAVPMAGRSATEGALLLSEMRAIQSKTAGRALEPLRLDDLLPIELLVARLQATRSQTMMFEKLIDSEKFAHLGQLAAGVTQQLNNPLTVVLGFATLLEETSPLSPQDRKAVQAILAEARNIQATIESLSRVARPFGDEPAAVSVAELLSDMSELHRPDFLSRSIDFHLSIAPELPRALCSPHHLRLAVRHCLKFAMDAVESPESTAEESKRIRLEAASEGGRVQILVGHSGSGFPNPERAFDPFASARPDGDTAAVGLSLCATILRDNNGRALAVNLEPQGAAIILELNAA